MSTETSCPRCSAATITTVIGRLCAECGLLEPAAATVTQITSHAALVHAEHRVDERVEPGSGQVDTLTDMTAFTAESSTAVGAFTWIQVTVSRFSYYAIVFVLIVVLAGASYNLFTRSHTRAEAPCRPDISHTSSEPATAGVSPSPTPVCK